MKKTILIILFSVPITLGLFGQNLDIRILRSINLNRPVSLDPSFGFISNSVLPLSIATPVTFLVVGKVTHNQTMIRDGLTAGASILFNESMTLMIKYSIKRQRPYAKYSDIQPQMMDSDPSFPSGHTSNAFCTATTLSLIYPKWYVIAPSYLWAGLVGYSRLDLGMHYPSDVLAGALIGTGSAILCYKVRRYLERKYAKKQMNVQDSVD